MATPTYDLLDSTTLTSSASSVTFSSISQDYRDLVLVVNCIAASAGDSLRPRINGDSGSNYYQVVMYGNGSSATSASNTSSYIDLQGINFSTTARTLFVFNFNDYSAIDKHKPILIRSNKPDNSTHAAASRWANTSAITSVEIGAGGTTFAAGSTFHLYGIAS